MAISSLLNVFRVIFFSFFFLFFYQILKKQFLNIHFKIAVGWYWFSNKTEKNKNIYIIRRIMYFRASLKLRDLWPPITSHSQLMSHEPRHNVSKANKAADSLTQHIRWSVPGDEARVVPIAHPLLQDAFAEILAEAAARCHQAVVAAVCLRKSADDSSGNQSTVREHGQHHLHTSSRSTRTGQASSPASLASNVRGDTMLTC